MWYDSHQPGVKANANRHGTLKCSGMSQTPPGPAIPGPLTSTALHIFDLNCSVCITHVWLPPLGPHTKSGMSNPMADTLHTMITDIHMTDSNIKQLSKPSPWNHCAPHSDRITSIRQLITEYPNQFEGIGHFSGEYKIYLFDDACPIIHKPFDEILWKNLANALAHLQWVMVCPQQ